MQVKLHWKGKVYTVKEDDLFEIAMKAERHMPASDVLANIAANRIHGAAFAAIFRDAMLFLQVPDVPSIGPLLKAAHAEHAVLMAAAKKGLTVDEKQTPVISFVGSWAASMFEGVEDALRVAGVSDEGQDTPKKKPKQSASKPSKSVSGTGG